MIILIAIAAILVLLAVLEPADHTPSLRSADRDEIRSASDLQAISR